MSDDFVKVKVNQCNVVGTKVQIDVNSVDEYARNTANVAFANTIILQGIDSTQNLRIQAAFDTANNANVSLNIDQYARNVANTAYDLASLTFATVNTNVVLSPATKIYFANGNITLTLPNYATNPGVKFSIKNIGNSNVTISGVNVDGDSNVILSFKNSAIDLISDNTGWFIF